MTKHYNKRCTRCSQLKPIELFLEDRRECKTCRPCRQKAKRWEDGRMLSPQTPLHRPKADEQWRMFCQMMKGYRFD